MTFCRGCGASLATGALACPECGAPAPRVAQVLAPPTARATTPARAPAHEGARPWPVALAVGVVVVFFALDILAMLVAARGVGAFALIRLVVPAIVSGLLVWGLWSRLNWVRHAAIVLGIVGMGRSFVLIILITTTSVSGLIIEWLRVALYLVGAFALLRPGTRALYR